MRDFIDEIVAIKKQEVLTLKQQGIRIDAVTDVNKPKKFQQALSISNLGIIAEIKKKSPSKGVLHSNLNVTEVAKEYIAAGASAISVLTESEYFNGSIDDLIAVKKIAATQTPVLRKDFIIDKLQLIQSKMAGADAVLLITGILRQQLADFIQCAEKIGLEVLVEVHSLSELRLAVASGAKIIGVNNRDLKTLAINPNNAAEILPYMPTNVIKIAESAISDAAAANKMQQLGFDAVLVGEALIKSNNRKQMLQQMQGVMA